MRYNTGNPIGPDGSSRPEDLHDNAGNLDLAMNDPVPGWWVDRLGVKRPNIAMALQLASTGQVNVFYAPDRPSAEILAADLGDGATVWIDSDEANGGVRTRNSVLGGELSGAVINTAATEQYMPAGIGAVPTTVQRKLREMGSFRDQGAAIDGVSEDAAAVEAAFAQGGTVLAEGGSSICTQARVRDAAFVIGNTELKTETQNRMLIYQTKPTAAPDDFLVPGFKIVGLKFGHMPSGTSDDFAGLHLAAGKAPVIALADFVDTESGVSASVIDSKFGQKGYGTKDALIFGNYFELTKRFVVQNIQASYSKIIGISANSNGDNTANGGDEESPGENNGGKNAGIRLAGLSKGNIVAASVIRDKGNSVSIQNGSDYNIVTGFLSENSYRDAISASAGGRPLGQSVVVGDTILKDSGAMGLSFRYMSHSRFSGLVDGTGKVAGSTQKYGVDLISSLATTDEVWRVEFTGGSGAVPGVGTTVTAGTSSSVLVSVEDENRVTVAAGAPMPSAGYVLVKSLTGDFFQPGSAFSSGLTATILKAYSCDGRHRIDATVRHAGSSGLRLGSNGNIVDLIAEAGESTAAEISGSYNLVRIVVADNRNTTHVSVSGDNNVIEIVDNSLVNRTAINVSGNRNKIIGSVRGTVYVGGSYNSTDVVASGTINSAGSNNDIGGSCGALIKGAGTGNIYTRLRGSKESGSASFTTDSTGLFVVTHDLILAATLGSAKIRSSTTPYVITSVNPANSLKNSSFKMWNLGGTPAAYTTATVDWEVEI